MTDQTGNVLERNDYYGFGSRMYDPYLCRWISPDPLAEKYRSLSPYAYCAGDPVNFVDPDGMDPIYQTRFFKPKLIGDDGQDQGMVYFVRGRKAREVKDTPEGKNYTGELYADKNTVAIPYDQVIDYIKDSVDESDISKKENGGHVNSDGSVVRWNWHVHPDTFVEGAIMGGASRSGRDRPMQKGLAEANPPYQGGALIVGMRHDNVLIYKNKAVGRIKWKEFLKLR